MITKNEKVKFRHFISRMWLLFLVMSMVWVIESYNFTTGEAISPVSIGLIAMVGFVIGYWHYAHSRFVLFGTKASDSSWNISGIVLACVNSIYAVTIQTDIGNLLPTWLLLGALAFASFFLLGRKIGEIAELYFVIAHKP